MEYFKNLEIENISYFDDDGNEQVEQWKDIMNYEGIYELSCLGRIKSLDKLVNAKHSKIRFVRGKILKQTMQKGYLGVGLYKNKKASRFRINRLVGFHFVPNPDNKPEVNHKKGVKTDNRYWMLEWNTRSENQKHAYDSGLQIPVKGEQVNGSKLTEKNCTNLKDCLSDFFLNLGNPDCPLKNRVKEVSKCLNDCCKACELTSLSHWHSFLRSVNCLDRSKQSRLIRLAAQAICFVSNAKLYTNLTLPMCLFIRTACSFVGRSAYLKAFNTRQIYAIYRKEHKWLINIFLIISPINLIPAILFCNINSLHLYVAFNEF